MGDNLAAARAHAPGCLIPRDTVVAWLEEERAARGAGLSPVSTVELAAAPAATWRERIWTVPSETILVGDEVCEAFARPKSWLYKLTSAKGIPFARLDGVLVFKAGELRAWARDRTEVVVAGPMEGTAEERGLRALPRAG